MQEFRLSAMEERNYGIDLLRIVSMMMVVLLHVLGQGGILDGSDPLTVKSETLASGDRSLQCGKYLRYDIRLCRVWAEV